MEIQSISKALKQNNTILFLSLKSPRNIISAQFLHSAPSAFDEQLLYITRLSQLLGLAVIPQDTNFLCICDRSWQTEELEDLPVNLILLPENNDEIAVFNQVQEILGGPTRLTLNSMRLIKAVIYRSSPQKLVNICSEILGNTVVFADKNTQLIARSHYQDGKGTLWEEHGVYGRFSEETMNSERYKIMQEILHEAAEPVLLPKLTSDYTTITGKVVTDNALLGYFSVLDTSRPLKEEDKQLVAAICDILAGYMRNNIQYTNPPEIRRENYIKMLLDGDYAYAGLAEGQSRSLDLNVDKAYWVMSIDIAQADKNQISTLLSASAKDIPWGKSAIYKNYIVIISSRDFSTLTTQETTRLNNFLLKHRVWAGISCQADTAIQLRESFDQAVTAINLGRLLYDQKRIFRYDDYIIPHLWSTLSGHIDLKKYCHPALPELMAYDDKNATQLTKTLYEYLINASNQTLTANKLSIHRASLVYRIEKLQELCKLDLSNARLRNYLYSSFQMLLVIDRENMQKHI